ncbi:dihydroneopterin aldolase [Maribellus maritimus]|uniref:dihydroneopterin aldolase n=1 Tax=Maribellus maritimus TaxID=2870838 RepID=UPI001EEBC851|nr:dihydroneopterin aldolase [Maribellus maritimus]MCG6187881.1 dihydroneopterin aldolase [Maribellus maritimus]
MGIIEIERMQFYAFHGHYKTERVVGNNFEVYLRFETDCSTAAISDNLNDTTNYQEVYNLVKKEMQNTSHLLEHVAQRILNSLFKNFPEIKNAQVKISKINPPMGGEIEKVSVTLSQKTK